MFSILYHKINVFVGIRKRNEGINIRKCLSAEKRREEIEVNVGDLVGKNHKQRLFTINIITNTKPA